MSSADVCFYTFGKASLCFTELQHMQQSPSIRMLAVRKNDQNKTEHLQTASPPCMVKPSLAHHMASQLLTAGMCRSADLRDVITPEPLPPHDTQNSILGGYGSWFSCCFAICMHGLEQLTFRRRALSFVVLVPCHLLALLEPLHEAVESISSSQSILLGEKALLYAVIMHCKHPSSPCGAGAANPKARIRSGS
eukprot:1583612-Amphidinium_carterae.1